MDRMRLARAASSDGILRCYDPETAFGQHVLRLGMQVSLPTSAPPFPSVELKYQLLAKGAHMPQKCIGKFKVRSSNVDFSRALSLLSRALK
jgi:hypothetical protein